MVDVDLEIDIGCKSEWFQEKKVLEDEIQQHFIPQIVLVKGVLASCYLFFYAKKRGCMQVWWIFSSLFLSVFFDFEIIHPMSSLCLSRFSTAVASRLPNKMSPRSPRRTPTPYEEMISGGILRREPLNEVAMYWGPPKKWECSKLGKMNIRKEGQTVKKKRWQQKKFGVFFSLQTFFHGKQTLISVLVQKWLWIGICVRTWFTTLWFQSFVSTILMRTSIKWTLFLSDSFSYEDVLPIISGAII